MHGSEGGSRLGHVKSDAKRGLHYAAHRTVVALPKRRKPEGRSRSGARGELPHAATREFARSYRINLRLLSELAFSSEHDGGNGLVGCAIARTRKPALSARLRRRGDVLRKLHFRKCGLLLFPKRKKRSGRGALFASSVSLTSPLRSEVPEKTKVATSISRSIPFHPVLIKPYVTGWNADASKSGRILRFFRRSTGREKPPRPWGWG